MQDTSSVSSGIGTNLLDAIISPEVFAAVIVVIGGFLATYFGSVVPKKKKIKKLESRIDALATERDSAIREKGDLERAIAEAAGKTSNEALFNYDRITRTLVIDDNGDAERITEYHGLKTSHSFSDFTVPYQAHVNCPDSSMSEAEVEELPTSALKVTNAGMKVLGGDENGCIYRASIKVHGVLGPATGGVSFRIRQKIEHGFCVWREELELAYPNDLIQQEFAGLGIPVGSANELTVSVTLPRSHLDLVPAPTPLVLLYGTETPHQPETRRITQRLNPTGLTYTLHVQKPLTGLVYGLAWLPPRRGS